MNADQLAELEDERRFLLRSLRDLDAELAAGDVDHADYDTLRDGYTRRAADVLRSIEAGKAALPAKRSRRWGRRAAIVAAVLAVAVGIGVVAARTAGERTAGDGTGARPDTATLLASARSQLGSDPRLAQDAYTAVLDREPDNPEALTYSGWLLYFASAGASADVRDAAVTTAKGQLARAVDVDPSYPDPHCFLAVIAADEDGDDATARSEADACLALDPPAEVRQLIDSFTATLGSTAPG